MPPTSPQSDAQTSRAAVTLSEALWGGLALLLIPIYLNTIIIWRWLEATLSAWILLAIPLLLMLGLAISLLLKGRSRARGQWRRVAAWLFLAGLLSGAVWLVTDPQFPAKRVHLFEYALLALVARRIFWHRMGEPLRSIAGVLVAGVLGLHDELLQGLHPDRYFAAKDVAVNLLSAGVGGTLAYAFAGDPTDRMAKTMTRDEWAVIAVSMIGLAGFVHTLSIPGAPAVGGFGLALPLAGIIAWLLLCRGRSLTDAGPRLATVVVGVSASAAVIPMAGILLDLPFD